MKDEKHKKSWSDNTIFLEDRVALFDNFKTLLTRTHK